MIFFYTLSNMQKNDAGDKINFGSNENTFFVHVGNFMDMYLFKSQDSYLSKYAHACVW